MTIYFEDNLTKENAVGRRVRATEIYEAGIYGRAIIGVLQRDERGYSIDPEKINWGKRAIAFGALELYANEPRPIRLGSETTMISEEKDAA